MEVTSNVSFRNLMTPRCYFPLYFSNSDPFFASLIILLALCGDKINMGQLSGKFVTVPVALNFLNIALTVDMAIFR